MNVEAMPAALVTGGGGGIGAAVAREWVAGGGRVALLDLELAKAQAVADELGRDVASAHAADVRDVAQIDAAMAEIADRYKGTLAGLVNCAGVAGAYVHATGSDDDWTRMIDIHLNGTARLCRAAFPLLSSAPSAAVVNVSSMAASRGLTQRANYCAAKAGIEGLTRALAMEWSPSIRVNAVAPGFVQTPLIDALIAEGSLDTAPVIARTPLRRFCRPDEVASAVTFLLSDKAGFITGCVLPIDGGLTMEGDWYGLQR